MDKHTQMQKLKDKHVFITQKEVVIVLSNANHFDDGLCDLT